VVYQKEAKKRSLNGHGKEATGFGAGMATALAVTMSTVASPKAAKTTTTMMLLCKYRGQWSHLEGDIDRAGDGLA
jgi:hypothetical protein